MLELADDVAPTTQVCHSGEELGRLSINEKTVGVLVGRVLSKVDVSGRVEAAVVAIRLGLTAV